ncbi:MAG: chloride channel protein [Acidimicrobiales bacterium]|nr:chloride channel protein [Acidimicrobiales bacterium]
MKDRIFRFAAYAAVGVFTGLIVSGLEFVAVHLLFDHVLEAPLWVRTVSPGAGLLVAVLILRVVGGGLSPATSEEYIAAYHDRKPRIRSKHLPIRLPAGAATIGGGGALGLEGPSIYAGATVGAAVQHRLRRLFRDKDRKALMVAGAAAGVAAIFKTPATGVLFALESPYQGDVARRALLPALIASAASYVTFVAFFGTDEIFSADRITGLVSDPEAAETLLRFDSTELWGAALVGLMAGAGALIFSRMVKVAKKISAEQPWYLRVAGGAVILGGLVLLSDWLYERPMSMGPSAGENILDWVLEPDHGIGLLLLLLGIRMVATTVTLGAGGVGGVFIPLAIFGLISGRIVGEALGDPTAISLYPFIGLAAFLGAGYRTPLTSVMFVAESTGNTAFVVPGLVAVAVSQVFVGGASVSSYQRATRSGHLERRFRLPVTSALRTDVDTIGPDTSINDFVWNHALLRKETDVVVADDERYLGMCSVHDASTIERDQWNSTPVSAIMRRVRPARLSMTLREATEVMEEQDVEKIPVTDGSGRFVGAVLSDDILKLDEILEETSGQ